MAAPHVAGLAALTLSANPALSADELREVLVAGAQTDIVASASQGGIDASYAVAFAAANYVAPVKASSQTPARVSSAEFDSVTSLLAASPTIAVNKRAASDLAQRELHFAAAPQVARSIPIWNAPYKSIDRDRVAFRTRSLQAELERVDFVMESFSDVLRSQLDAGKIV